MSTKKILSIVMGLILVGVCSLLLFTFSDTNESMFNAKDTSERLDTKTSSNNWIAIDGDSGAVLDQNTKTNKVPIASLVKVLVAYTVLREVENKHIKLTDTAQLSAYGQAITQDMQLSNAPMGMHETYTVEELLEVMMTLSANNAAITLSEKVAGSEQAFITLMKKNLEQMGISDYVLNNVTGLDAASIPNEFNNAKQTNLFKAKDLSIIVKTLIKEYPEILKITSEPKVLLNNTVLYNTNQFITQETEHPRGWDIKGFKTGTSESAGYGLITVGTNKISQKNVVVVVLEAKTNEVRYEDTRRIYESVADLL